MLSTGLIVASLHCASFAVPRTPHPAIADTPFVQEYRTEHTVGSDAAENDVRAVAFDGQGHAWAATRAGLRTLRSSQWINPMNPEDAGPAFCAASDPSGTVWIGAWNGLYRCLPDGAVERIPEISHPISAVCASSQGVVAMGPEGKWENMSGSWRHSMGRWPRSPRAITLDRNNRLWVATGHGLFRLYGDDVEAEYHDEHEILTGELRGVACGPDGRIWSSGLGGIDVYAEGERVASYSTGEGLPSFEAGSLAFHPDGVLWIATPIGAVRFDGVHWSLRHSRRWLPSDNVRHIAFNATGAAWIATDSGIAVIQRRTMTLAEKADHYLAACLERHVRDPWLVEKCFLTRPGDLSSWTPMDDDNDGQYTAMYLAMECFRYAVTQDPQARENARKAFNALEFLQKVTGTEGFVARTVIPREWTRMHDPNCTYSPQEYAERQVADPRWKKVEQLWRPSADGKWLWKGDTSSDEITGHFYGYLMYYDLVADETERERVRAHVRRIMDHIIDGNFALRDIDGTPTRWAVWTPEILNQNPDWRAERPTNSVEILSFLKVTHYMTGDPKYQDAYRRLIDEHGYAETARRPKPTALSERTHIDVELLMLAFPGLIEKESDPELRQKYLEGLDFLIDIVRTECSPYYGFVYGSLGDKDFMQEGCVDYLRDTPLDLIKWTVDNSEREDVRLVRAPEPESWQTDRLLPASERGVMRWDNNPWVAVQGAGGAVESSGVFWLLPYWMGRYYGFISPPAR